MTRPACIHCHATGTALQSHALRCPIRQRAELDALLHKLHRTIKPRQGLTRAQLAALPPGRF